MNFQVKNDMMLLRDMMLLCDMWLRDIMWPRDVTVPTMLFQSVPTVISLLTDLELHRRVKVSNSKHKAQSSCAPVYVISSPKP